LPFPGRGGVSVFFAAAAVASILFIHTSPRFTTPGSVGVGQLNFLAGAFIGSGFLFLVGLVDDIRGLSPGIKLLAQSFAAAIASAIGAKIDAISLGYGAGISLGWVGVPLLILWIV